MTEEQLETARKYEDFHREAFGYEKSNVTFKKGLIEKLGDVGIEDGSIDVIVSNCVINLVPDKESVIKEVGANFQAVLKFCIGRSSFERRRRTVLQRCLF